MPFALTVLSCGAPVVSFRFEEIRFLGQTRTLGLRLKKLNSSHGPVLLED